MGYEHIEVRVDGNIARVTLSRPERFNAMSLDLLREAIDALEEVSGDRTVQVVIIDGAGRGFSVGHDLTEMIDRDRSFYDELFNTCTVMMEKIQAIPQPVIAQVHGVAAAAGCQLVAACDLAVASEDSMFGTTGLRVGLFCSTPMVPLSRAIGRKRALEMLLTGEMISAETAGSWGLVNRVVPAAQLESATLELAAQIIRYSPEVIGLGKAAFYAQVEMPQATAYGMTKDVIAANATIPDGQEGMKAFLDKREPVWTGSVES
jgi:enoyl-CoA hydratase/carnithine racemase